MVEVSKSNGGEGWIFESERCYIRSFLHEDIDEFMVYRNNLEWMQFQGFKGLTREEYEEALLKEPLFERGVQFAIVSKSDQHLIGDVYMQKEEDIFWIGYTINPSFKRQGYAFEIISSMILWIKGQGEYKIMAGVEPENTASIRLLEKSHFVQERLDDGEIIYALHQV